MSQKALSTSVGVSQSAAAQWERSTGTMPSVEHLAQIAVATSVAFEWLATGRGEPRLGNADPPAAILGDFASSPDEDRFLKLSRKMPHRLRARLLDWLEAVFD